MLLTQRHIHPDAVPFLACITSGDRVCHQQGATYFLLPNGNASQYFAVDATTGVITTKGPGVFFDREMLTSVEIVLMATDGYRYSTSPLTLTVTLNNLNDIVPEFADTSYTATIPENSIGTIVTVAATDPDVIPEQVTYALGESQWVLVCAIVWECVSCLGVALV